MAPLDPSSFQQLLEETRIGKYQVKAYVEFGDVLLRGRGLAIRFPEKTSAPSFVQERKGNTAASLLHDPVFAAMLKEFGDKWRQCVWEQMRKDWGEKSFVPDEKGDFHHPFLIRSGKTFTCLHCEKRFSGAKVVANFWNCPDPECDGSPIDMM